MVEAKGGESRLSTEGYDRSVCVGSIVRKTHLTSRGVCQLKVDDQPDWAVLAFGLMTAGVADGRG